ncbi:TPA: DUF3307 domain-containing protein [Streptococcus equi subsp. zooepidemicus]|uniref:DUF3307 domain-containing protein n=1 Tax=Streptococcus equi TaxID=1336 RepID=UPI0013F5D081|nr:DUF3307 domain-containing protein [Streptococcus equi]MCD3410093.1 DUF3307 domain-containing protein [Streptococcus equi subsp. zooepidemicus]MCD3446346.1 DUF3307 domain-containing protein [Streptococcus equi subsp. zooepidemicus]HEL0656112.1 DUF3307 domain-containing protein [Streptococcus equi subsp. zooepidemicus]HEL1173004.1 DUF3307 domain-containing protein [Streptococcus equi subsp. zooepidemicus]
MQGLSDYLYQHPILVLLVICHFLSDYHLQSQLIADKKEEKFAYLGLHLLGIAAPLFLVVMCIPKLWLTAILIFSSHAVIDYFKPKWARIIKLDRSWIFVLDQLLHLFIILALAARVNQVELPDWLHARQLLLVLFIVLITKPVNIIFKLCFNKFQPSGDKPMDTIVGTGAAIGNLERIVMGVCMVMGQFASIGLVLTAKSIARYNKISESPAFAEYYLIGSLFSVLSVFIAAWLCFF